MAESKEHLIFTLMEARSNLIGRIGAFQSSVSERPKNLLLMRSIYNAIFELENAINCLSEEDLDALADKLDL